MSSEIPGFLGIDNGTQGLSVVFTDESLKVLATGEASYDMVPGLGEGCYEQLTEDWDSALAEAMRQVREKIPNLKILAIGISGQMHGEVLVGENGKSLGPVRLWCDARNEQESLELQNLFGVKVPKRSTVARFLWTIRNRPALAKDTKRITTPAGWVSYRLTGEWNLGVGDASGMFPIDQTTMTYDKSLLDSFDKLINTGEISIPPLGDLLPRVCVAGQTAGSVCTAASKAFRIPEGVPVAPAEGDQPAALAGSLIAKAGTVSCSFGTSVCANSVGDRPFSGVSPAVDHFCAVDGKPINMVWLRNGTTFLNTVVESYGRMIPNGDKGNAFATIMPLLVEAEPDCGGLIALPFMDDEPGLRVSQGGSALVMGWTSSNATPGNVAKSALLSTIFNLKMGSAVLDRQGYPRTEIVLTGGLAKTPQCAQIIADVFDTPVSLLHSSEEGCSWGAAVMAKFLHRKMNGGTDEQWTSFLETVNNGEAATRFEPKDEDVQVYQRIFKRYQDLVQLVPQLAVSPTTSGDKL